MAILDIVYYYSTEQNNNTGNSKFYPDNYPAQITIMDR